eukprot:scaffold48089_cov53-Phaeocystis_antarctica.AAC.4
MRLTARAPCWQAQSKVGTSALRTRGAGMAVLVALSVLAQRLIELDDESATEVMDGPLDVLLMFETRWCKASQKTRPMWLARAAHGADGPRLAGACGSLRHALALKEAFGAPAGRRLGNLGFDIGAKRAACSSLTWLGCTS